MNIKDKFKEVLSKDLTDFQKKDILEMQEDYLKVEALNELRESSIMNDFLSDISLTVENIEVDLLKQVVRNTEQQLEREKLQAKRECYLDVLDRFSIPDTKWIEEKLQEYE